MGKKRKEIDLSRLGRRSWIKEAIEPPPERDDSVVTAYTKVPHSGIEELQRRLREGPDNPALREMLAFMLYSNDRLDEAFELYRDLLEHGHNVASQHLYLGNIYYKKNLLQMALDQWGAAVKKGRDTEEGRKAAERTQKLRDGVAIRFDDTGPEEG